jgi:hypothetical protein
MVGHKAPGQQICKGTDMLFDLLKKIGIVLFPEKDLSMVISLVVEMINRPPLKIHLFLILSEVTG